MLRWENLEWVLGFVENIPGVLAMHGHFGRLIYFEILVIKHLEEFITQVFYPALGCTWQITASFYSKTYFSSFPHQG